MFRLPLVHRLRFSLRTFLVTLFVLSLIGSNLYVSFKWRQAQGEIQRLRDELGVLNIDDPSRIYVRLDPMSDDLTWRWRVYVPPGHFGWCLGTGGIPKAGTKVTGGGGGSAAPPGQYTITARVERSALGKWQFNLSGPGFAHMAAILPPNDGWLDGRSDQALGQSLSQTRRTVAGFQEAESFSADEPAVLLRLRAPKKDKPPDENCDGLMIWLHKEPPLPGTSPTPPAQTFRPR